MHITEYRNQLEQRKGRRDALAQDITRNELRIAELHQEMIDCEKARAIVQTVAKQTQEQLEYHVSELATLALAAIFDNPYSLALEFTVRRGKTEADLWLERDGERVKAMDATGGGVVDVLSFALRAALWSLRRPRSRSVLFLDEPFKHLSATLHERAATMLQEVSQNLKLQIIGVTHSAPLIEGADRVFTVTQAKDGKSKVTCGATI